MGGRLQIRPESGRADRKAFVEVPYRLYRDHPVWVPPLRIMDKALMDARKNPFFQHAAVQHFLAHRGDRVVGRIAAIENRRHNEFHGDRVGFFGFFDAEPDPEAARGLVDAARTWTKERGLGPLRGPVNYSTNDSCGVLVDGFDLPPMILMPYNRPDYDELLRGTGLAPAKDLVALWIPTPEAVPERFERIVQRALDRRRIKLRPIDLAQFDEEIPRLRDVYNQSWELNWGFVPSTDDEFQHLAKEMKPLLDPHLSAVAEVDGEPVGFSIVVKDLNEILRPLRGRLFPLGVFRLLLGMKRIRARRIVALGVIPSARGRGVNEAFFAHALRGARETGVSGGEAGWVLEDNAPMQAPILAAGGTVTKRYRLYEDAD